MVGVGWTRTREVTISNQVGAGEVNGLVVARSDLGDGRQALVKWLSYILVQKNTTVITASIAVI